MFYLRLDFREISWSTDTVSQAEMASINQAWENIETVLHTENRRLDLSLLGSSLLDLSRLSFRFYTWKNPPLSLADAAVIREIVRVHRREMPEQILDFRLAPTLSGQFSLRNFSKFKKLKPKPRVSK